MQDSITGGRIISSEDLKLVAVQTNRGVELGIQMLHNSSKSSNACL
jgi:hypothetical protein